MIYVLIYSKMRVSLNALILTCVKGFKSKSTFNKFVRGSRLMSMLIVLKIWISPDALKPISVDQFQLFVGC